MEKTGRKVHGKRKLEEMSTDDFLLEGLGDNSESGESSESELPENSESDAVQHTSGRKDVAGGRRAETHKQTLGKLQDIDPEFYEFLKNEDQSLLNFEDSDDLEEDSGEEEDEEVEGGTVDGDRLRHRPPAKLEVASDDSAGDESSEDEEGNAEKLKPGQRELVTLKMVNSWSQQMKSGSMLSAFHNAVMAFKAAVQQTSPHDAQTTSRFKVEGSTVFNSIMRMCLTDMLPMINQFLNLPKPKDPTKLVLPSSCQKWMRVRIDVKSYLTDVLQMMSQVVEAAILNVMLKHVFQLTPYFCCFPQLLRQLLRKLIILWSTADETSRVLAFLSINRAVRRMPDSLLEFVIKNMYMAYVKNCKFTAPTSLPNINFMQHSLVEILTVDLHVTYQYAFIYIRQLAIHLRNAITTRKKESIQAVYNWQYIHSVHLWVKLLAAPYSSNVLQPLVYPLTQTIIGTIKLIPTQKFYPLRFQCVRALNLLSKSTSTYIPVLPFLTEVFEQTDFNKKPSAISFRPFNFACILKLSKKQVQEKAFREGVIDQLYELLLENFCIHAHCVSFPELALPTLLQLKQFVKQCKVANFTKQIKQIIEKVEETCRMITQRRKSAAFNLADCNSVNAWENQSKQAGTALSKFYSTWRSLRDRELQYEIAGKERISTDDLPVIDRASGTKKKASEEERKEFSELFESDSEGSDDDDETRFLPKGERPKKKQKTEVKEEGSDSEYSSFDEEELEQLARSASEEEDEDEKDDEEDSEHKEDDDTDSEMDEDDDTDSEMDKDSSMEESDAELSNRSQEEDILEEFRLSDFEDN